MFALSVALYVTLIFTLGLFSYNIGKMFPFFFELHYLNGRDKDLEFFFQILYCFYYFPVVTLYWYYDRYIKKVPMEISYAINTALVFAHIFLAYFINCKNKLLAIITASMIGMMAGVIVELTLCCIPNREIRNGITETEMSQLRINKRYNNDLTPKNSK